MTLSPELDTLAGERYRIERELGRRVALKVLHHVTRGNLFRPPAISLSEAAEGRPHNAVPFSKTGMAAGGSLHEHHTGPD
jgi:hypothetical protein